MENAKEILAFFLRGSWLKREHDYHLAKVRYFFTQLASFLPKYFPHEREKIFSTPIGGRILDEFESSYHSYFSKPAVFRSYIAKL